VYIHLNQCASEYTRKSPCIFTLNQNHKGIFTEFPCPFLTVGETNSKRILVNSIKFSGYVTFKGTVPRKSMRDFDLGCYLWSELRPDLEDFSKRRRQNEQRG
jgi:hypothetical protein